MYANDEAKM